MLSDESICLTNAKRESVLICVEVGVVTLCRTTVYSLYQVCGDPTLDWEENRTNHLTQNCYNMQV